MPKHLAHPHNPDLRALRQLERSIEAQLKLEHLIGEQDRREIDLATCFPDGYLILHGHIESLQRTLDPEVFRCFVIQDGIRKGMIYINTRRKKCTVMDCLIHL